MESEKTLLKVSCACGFRVGLYQRYFTNGLQNGISPDKLLVRIGVRRNCCMIRFIAPPVMPRDYPQRTKPDPRNKTLYPELDEIREKLGSIFFIAEQTSHKQIPTVFTGANV